MFEGSDMSQLEDELEQFPMPLFTAERLGEDGEFRVLCVNSAHEAACGLSREDVKGRTIHELLPKADADAVVEKYERCLRSGETLRYVETLRIADRDQKWETSIKPVRGHGGSRLIGQARRLPERELQDDEAGLRTELHCAAIDAGFHLSRIDAWLAEVEGQRLFPHEVPASAGAVRAICRALESVLSDMRRDAAALNEAAGRMRQVSAAATVQPADDGTAGAMCGAALNRRPC